MQHNSTCLLSGYFEENFDQVCHEMAQVLLIQTNNLTLSHVEAVCVLDNLLAESDGSSSAALI